MESKKTSLKASRKTFPRDTNCALVWFSSRRILAALSRVSLGRFQRLHGRRLISGLINRLAGGVLIQFQNFVGLSVAVVVLVVVAGGIVLRFQIALRWRQEGVLDQRDVILLRNQRLLVHSQRIGKPVADDGNNREPYAKITWGKITWYSQWFLLTSCKYREWLVFRCRPVCWAAGFCGEECTMICRHLPHRRRSASVCAKNTWDKTYV